MAETRRYAARGLSMLPGIYPRDWLHVEIVRPREVAVGDLIAHVGTDRVVCHRVVSMERRAGERWYELRGDAQVGTEWVPEEALVFAVTEVDGRLGRWRVQGPRGRLLRRWALSRRPPWRGLRLAVAASLRAYARLRQKIAGH